MNFAGPALTFVAFTIYAILHSLLASLWAKSKARTSFGVTSDRYYRFAFNLIGTLTFIPVLVVPAYLPGETLYRVNWPWLAVTTLLQLSGAAIILLGLLQTDVWHFLGLRQLTNNSPSTVNQLIIGGLYRYMRHPLYTGGLLLIWFLPGMTTSLLAFNLAATSYLYVGSLFEERRLIIEFGDAYRDYQKRVRRFVPLPVINPRP